MSAQRQSPQRQSAIARTVQRDVEPVRTMVLWCPDWPVTAVQRAHSLAPDAPLALIDRSTVFACSASARSEGVRRGMRVREAQARCPELQVRPYEEVLDLREFEPVLEAIESTMPGVQLLRPGTCAIRARGPARYYGSEEEAALWLLDALGELGIHGARIGIADGPFTAEHAARSTSRQRIGIVPAGRSAEFLAPLPVGLVGEQGLATLLKRLGIRTLGEFAKLGGADVDARFGETGAWLHALASGLDSKPVTARIPPKELDSVTDFEPALDRIDQVTFGVRAAADRFIAELIRAQLVCTALLVIAHSESDELSSRIWLHPRSFTAADVVDRVRWQLQGSGSVDSGLSSGITRVQLVPESVDAIGHHEEGLWGSGADERIHHGLSRVQSMLGHGGVLTAVLAGGRTMLDRQELVAWGDRPVGARTPDGRAPRQPWPGALPTPAPSTVFPHPLPAIVVDAVGTAIDVDARDILTGVPASFSTDGRTLLQVRAWAGPWTIDERWWSEDRRRASRFQVVDESGTAWLLVLDEHRWWAEARYD